MATDRDRAAERMAFPNRKAILAQYRCAAGWPATHREALAMLAADGMPASGAAESLNRLFGGGFDTGQVARMARRLGLALSSLPGGQGRKVGRRASGGPPAPPLKLPPAPEPAPRIWRRRADPDRLTSLQQSDLTRLKVVPPVLSPLELPAQPTAPGPKRLVDCQSSDCRWPLSGRGAETLFCAEARAETGSYCPAHAERSRQKRRVSA